jgi:hypothetical protein
MSSVTYSKILVTILIGLLFQLQKSNGASFANQIETIKEIELLRDSIVNKLLKLKENANSNGLNLLNYKSDKNHDSKNFMSLNVVSPQAEALPATSKPFTAVFVPDGYTMFKLDLPADFNSGEYFTIE